MVKDAGPVEEIGLMHKRVTGAEFLNDPEIAWHENNKRDRNVDDIAEIYHENSKLNRHDLPQMGASTGLFFTPKVAKVSAKTHRSFDNHTTYELPRDIPSLDTSLEEAIMKRRSVRKMSGEMSQRDLSALLYYALGINDVQVNRDQDGEPYSLPLRSYASGGGLYPVDHYLYVSNVEGIPKGAYHYEPRRHELQVVNRPEDFEERYAEQFLWGPEGQVIEGQAIHLLHTANFWRSRAKYGDRGYRFVLQESGHAAQNVYLVAGALGLGACAVAGFLDDEVNDLLGLDGVNESVIHTMIVGHPDEPVRRRSPVGPGEFYDPPSNGGGADGR